MNEQLQNVLNSLRQNTLRVTENIIEFMPTVSTFTYDIGQLGSRAGIEINLDDIELIDGVWTYCGQHVLLFIPNQGFDIEMVLKGDKEGKKFHLTDCETITTMKAKNRFESYKVTNNIEGIFEIFGKNNQGEYITVEHELRVCKNCLDKLKYKNYSHKASYSYKKQVYENFNIKEFFAEFKTKFETLPDDVGQDKAGYAPNWADISKKYRQSQDWRCQSCGVSLTNHQHLLHVHHINGVTQDNRPSNLKAVCVECHSHEPNHCHMKISSADQALLGRLRQTNELLELDIGRLF